MPYENELIALTNFALSIMITIFILFWMITILNNKKPHKTINFYVVSIIMILLFITQWIFNIMD